MTPSFDLILTGFAQERRPGPLVRSALGVYRDIQFQKEMLLEQALDLSLRDVHASLCPACFGPRESTDLPDTIKEVYMAVDANFTHSRLKSSAKYDFSNIIPPSFLSKSHVSHAAKQYEESGADKVKVGKDSSVSQHLTFYVIRIPKQPLIGLFRQLESQGWGPERG